MQEAARHLAKEENEKDRDKLPFDVRQKMLCNVRRKYRSVLAKPFLTKMHKLNPPMNGNIIDFSFFEPLVQHHNPVLIVSNLFLEVTDASAFSELDAATTDRFVRLSHLTVVQSALAYLALKETIYFEAKSGAAELQEKAREVAQGP